MTDARAVRATNEPAGGLPTGTVTFLFTDIEGSTRLVERLGVAYEPLLVDHFRILEDAVRAVGGVPFGSEGDAFFAAFSRPDAALAAAAEAQRGLAIKDWPDGAPIRVRMGIHTGQVSLGAVGYVGVEIHRVARIVAAGHGGQVLVSAATRALVGDAPPAGATWRDLGAYRLRDFAEPERLSQLVVDGLPDAFPPLRTADARPNNLPSAVTTFVGRERELADARRLLMRARLITITGPGGIGKTRFALELAAAASGDFPDGISFVPLEPVSDPDLVPGTIALTVGIADSGTRPALEVLVEHLATRRLLLVLDNFEQVTPAARILGDLLRTTPDVRILVTSRAILHLSGEHEFPLGGLTMPPDPDRLGPLERSELIGAQGTLDPDRLLEFEAVRLFVDRATAARPSFVLGPDNAAAVARICARLDGMPLPIELAAVRVRLLSPDAILVRLERQFELLASGARDLPERQRTLRGAISWSYDLLDEPGRRLLERLSCFVDGCDLETAEAVCGPADEIGRDIFDGIAELADQSLLRRSEIDGEARFTMPDTIRAFALERLDARGEAPFIRRRHARAFLELARTAAPELAGADQRRWLERLEREHGNLRSALVWAVETPEPASALELSFALWRFWQKRGHLREARMRLDEIVTQPWAQDDPAAFARGLEALGGIAYWQGDLDAAKAAYLRSLDVWRDLGDRAEIANALYNYAFTYTINLADVDQAEALLQEALAIFRELGDRRGIGNVLWALGSGRTFTGRWAESRPIFEEARDEFRAAGDRTMEAWALHMYGFASVPLGDFPAAADAFSQALSHFVESGDISGQVLVIDDWATLALASGDKERGIRLWAAANRAQEAIGTGLVAAQLNTPGYAGWQVPQPEDATPERRAELEAEARSWTLDEAIAYATDGVLPGVR